MMRAWFETFALAAFDDFVSSVELLPNVRTRRVIINLNPMSAIPLPKVFLIVLECPNTLAGVPMVFGDELLCIVVRCARIEQQRLAG
jgi:hypothetical protein